MGKEYEAKFLDVNIERLRKKKFKKWRRISKTLDKKYKLKFFRERNKLQGLDLPSSLN